MNTDNVDTLIGTSNIDVLLEESKIFISGQAVESEIDYRLKREIGLVRGLLVGFRPGGEARDFEKSALTVLGTEHAVGLSRNHGATRLQVRNTSGRSNRLKPGYYLVCSDQALDLLRKEVRHYIAHEHVDQVYNLDFDLSAKLELRCRMEEVSRNITRIIAEAWSVIVHVTDYDVEYCMPDQVKAGSRLSQQITENIMPRLMNEGQASAQKIRNQ